MGIEIEINSLEDMCALMCDNRIPKKRGKDNEKCRGNGIICDRYDCVEETNNSKGRNDKRIQYIKSFR